MAHEPKQVIEFTDEYGQKIYLPVFSTFRGQNTRYEVGRIHDVVLVGISGRKDLGPHRITAIEYKRIRNVSASEIIMDLGKRMALPDPRATFFKLMRSFYKNNPWWDEEDTILQKLTLEKIRSDVSVLAS